ncbi:[FeFe] hydrogenase H-cluster maturation GTPase HydF [Spirochaeta isovalerica]|uniref:[FeFe] hydrogenase H-cluster maturation GTPase HydF n=1 Tax=Spirochaeta isovalerica TaxID=150 RepID=A0A841R3X2_9SPIO|nr:[FeFe] hydrogenase H-cluster maturation GTPase HydF [Spirochaeta isovalerica]MBB6478565.1 [FeFe] hydrogenase H-cluster maturation GTPase HydF [Spirochaeta isovalerica]
MATALAESTRIVLIGIRNAGKSSLMNTLFEKDISIISSTPGTTTDPVTRQMELGALGPVAITDTAGLDDEGELGKMRVMKTLESSAASAINIFVTPQDKAPTIEEKEILKELLIKNSRTPLVCVLTHSDCPANIEKVELVSPVPKVKVNNLTGEGAQQLRNLLIEQKEKLIPEMTPLEGLVDEGDLAVLVTPIDLAAPKGRLIMPQVQTIRDLLDKDCASLVVKERELYSFYNNLIQKPKLVITDSQVFHKVAADIPENQLLTSFSILFARKKGDLEEFIKGIINLKKTPEGGRILVMESCSHHRQADDIGTVRIPRLFRQLVHSNVEFDFTRTLPSDEDLEKYYMVIHCAGCMINREKMMDRLERIRRKGVFITNYGLFLGWVNGLLPRALEPFRDLYEEYREAFD